MDNVSVTWKDKGKWVPFDLADINHLSRDHAINLFSYKIPVVARHGNYYIVNNMDLFSRYDKNKKQVKLFSALTPSSEPLRRVGFI